MFEVGRRSQIVDHVVSDSGQDLLDFVAVRRRGDLHEFGAHDFAGLFQQPPQQMQRHIEPQAEFFGQRVVSFGMFHKQRHALVGEARIGAGGQFPMNLQVAASDQNIGDDRIERLAAGDRQQMRLALGACDVHEVGIGKSWRGDEHRARDRDLVIARQGPNDADRRIFDRSQALAEFLQRAGLHALDQMTEDLVENVDLIAIQPIACGEEQIGDFPKRFDAVRFRSALHRAFQFADQRTPQAGHGRTRFAFSLKLQFQIAL